MPKGTPGDVLTPGKNEKHYRAGAWDLRPQRLHYRVGSRQTNALFRNLLEALETRYPARCYDRIFVVVDNDSIHQAPAVERWLTAHSRFEWLWLPPYGPRAHPIERIFGDAHDKVTRNHKRKRYETWWPASVVIGTVMVPGMTGSRRSIRSRKSRPP
jgi:DDE superfamily endonuclease